MPDDKPEEDPPYWLQVSNESWAPPDPPKPADRTIQEPRSFRSFRPKLEDWSVFGVVAWTVVLLGVALVMLYLVGGVVAVWR